MVIARHLEWPSLFSAVSEAKPPFVNNSSWATGLVSGTKALVRQLLPERVLRWRARRISKRRALDAAKAYAGKRPREVFSAIYERGDWGRDGDFNSGSGSHYPSLVTPYMAAVQGLLKSTPQIRRVVDLGCGDFNVGQDIAPLVREYIACDVVPELIARNQQKFSLPNVTFSVLDIVEESLPWGDLAILRQVLQHLTNEQIERVVPEASSV